MRKILKCVSFRESQRFDKTGMYFVKVLKICNLSFPMCCTSTAALLKCAAGTKFCRCPVFRRSELTNWGSSSLWREEKFVKVKQAQVRISLPLWFPSGTHSNWSELPNGRRGDFPCGCCFTHRRVPPDFRQPQTIRQYLHSIIDSDRKQWWKVFEEADESLIVSAWVAGSFYSFAHIQGTETSEKVQQCFPVSTTVCV